MSISINSSRRSHDLTSIKGSLTNSHTKLNEKKDYDSFSKDSHQSVISDIKEWRRATLLDIEDIEKLVEPNVKSMFGHVDLAELIEKSFLSICQENTECHIIAFLCVCNYPNIPAVPKKCWEEWMHHKYQFDATVWNTLFIHYLAWDAKYSNYFFNPLLKCIFLNYCHITNIVIVAPPGAPTAFFNGDTLLDEFFTRMLPKGHVDFKTCQSLYLCMRESHIPRFIFRRAMEEDNDHIVPMLDTQCKLLREWYGDFYIAEIVGNEDETSRRLIVAETDERPVGVLCLSPEVDYRSLNESFDLTGFFGLKKQTVEDSIVMPEGGMEEENYFDLFQKDVDIRSWPSSDTGVSGTTSTSHRTKTKTRSLQEDDDDDTIEQDRITISEGGLIEEEEIEEEEEVEKDDGRDEDDDEELSLSTKDSCTGYSIHVLSHKMKVPRNVDTTILKFFTGMERESEDRLEVSNYGEKSKIPVYNAEPNAFIIELFGMNDEYDDRMAFDFLRSSFEVFPEYDFAVVLMPSECPMFSLLQHFTKVSARPIKKINQELYVLHKNAILAPLKVREASLQDSLRVKNFLEPITTRRQIYDEFWTSVSWEECPLTSFVVFSGHTLVGLAIVMAEDDTEYLRAHYNVDEHICFNLHKLDENTLIRHVVVNPIFYPYTRFIMSEIQRLTDTTNLYYCLYPKKKHESRYLIGTLDDMIPVSVRKPIIYDKDVLGEDMPAEAITKYEQPFALYHLGTTSVSLPKIHVNNNILVVGAGDTAISFLEGLFFSNSRQYLKFTNVTVVSPHGLPFSKSPNKIRDLMFPFTGKYDHDYMRHISLTTYTSVITGAMNGIDRKNKCISLNDHTYASYDMLFLFCGTQFQKPKQYRHEHADTFPENVFIINTELDAARSLKRLDTIMEDTTVTSKLVIVYGMAIEAFCCLTALIEFGIKPVHIVFIEPFPIPGAEFTVSILNDNDVDEMVIQSITNLGIKYYSSYFFIEWTRDPVKNIITAAKFESKFRFANLQCAAMFYYDKKSVSAKTFTALNRAGLVYDGKIVIDKNLKTNDPNIWAAGTMTKYARRYYADSYNHEHYNTTEIGRKLAESIVRMLDPTITDEEKKSDFDEDSRLDKTVTHYVEPKVINCIFPGPLNYLAVTNPGIVVPLDSNMSQESYGQSLVTGDATEEGCTAYFRLHLNQFSTVEDIICLTMNKLDVNNLIRLWGKHERLLNNLMFRFDRALIMDLYQFFKEPWAYALYHDQFNVLREANMKILKSPTIDPDDSIVEDIYKYIESNKYRKIKMSDKAAIEQRFSSSEYKKLIETGLLDFIYRHKAELPMYAHPNLLQPILGNIDAEKRKKFKEGFVLEPRIRGYQK